MESSGRGHHRGIWRILLPPDRLPHFQVDLSATNSGRADGVCRFGLGDLSVTAARRLSVPVQSGPRPPRARIGNAVAPRDGRERSTMEGAGQRADNFLTIRPVVCGYGNAASRRPERCNDTDWNGRQFDGKNATHLRESCGLSVSMADHHRSDRYTHHLQYRWVWDVRRNSEESRSVGTLISGRAQSLNQLTMYWGLGE